ncbi:MAG: polysaccharide biosynthesis C-terminal domain-containing protein [Lysobacterales bacterium]
MSSRFSALKRVGFSTISVYLELIGGFVISVIIARHLGPEDYGVYTFVIWLSGLTIAAGNLGVANAAIKFVAEAGSSDDPAKLTAVRNRLRNIQLVVLTVALLLLMTLSPYVFLPRIPAEFAPAIWLLVIASGAKAIYMFDYSVAKGLEVFGSIAAVVSVVMPLNLALVIFSTLSDQGVLSFVIVYTCACILSMLLMTVALRKRVKWAKPSVLEPALKKRMNRHVILVSLAFVVYILGRQQIEIYFLSLWSTKESIAYFSLSFALARSAKELLPGVLEMTILPMLARTFASSPETLHIKLLGSMRYMLILSMPVAMLGYGLAQPLISLVYGDSYLPAVMPMQVFMALAIVTAFSNPAIGYLVSVDKQHLNLSVGVFGAVLNIALDVFLIYRWGLTGAVIAAAITMITTGILLVLVAGRMSGAKLQVMTWLRILLAGLLALLPVYLVLPWIDGVVGLVLASAGFFAIYIVLTLLLGCWSKTDLSIFQRLLTRAPFAPRPVRKLLLSVRRRDLAARY